jgi:putative hydrolase of the HAD superfamily
MEQESGTSELVGRIKRLSDPMLPNPTGETEQLEPLSGIRAVFFDIYGTLMISGSGDVGVLREVQSGGSLLEALGRAGLPAAPKAGPLGRQMLLEEIEMAHADLKQQGVDYPEVEIRSIWRNVTRRLYRAGLLKKEADMADIHRLAVEYECRVNPVWPMPMMRETLNRILAKGLRLGIVSNAQFYTPLLFEALAGGRPEQAGFDPALIAYSFECLEAKPSVRLFEIVLEPLRLRWGIMPEQTVYVGNDMLNDIWTASQAGCRTVLFAGDQRSLRKRLDVPRCRTLEPNAVITRLDQLAGLLAP